MDETRKPFLHHLTNSSSTVKLFGGVLVSALILGTLTGYVLAKGNNSSGGQGPAIPLVSNAAPKTAQADQQTFRDFAEGTIQKKPASSGGDESEGTHLLVRTGGAQPVALTSSVVDLDQYVGKQVEVFGETQKAIKAGWLMDVGKVEVK